MANDKGCVFGYLLMKTIIKLV